MPKRETVTSEDGKYRVVQRSGVTNLLVYISTWTNVKVYKKRRNGRWKRYSADSISITGTGLAESENFGGQSIDYSKAKRNKKKLVANTSWFNLGEYIMSGFGSSGRSVVEDSKFGTLTAETSTEE